MPSFIRLDMFPATVTAGGNVYAPCRAIVTDDTLFVYMDSSDGPKEVFSGRMDDFTGRRTIGYEVTLADESIARIDRAGGCGCGSRLKGFRPFTGVPQIATQ